MQPPPSPSSSSSMWADGSGTYMDTSNSENVASEIFEEIKKDGNSPMNNPSSDASNRGHASKENELKKKGFLASLSVFTASLHAMCLVFFGLSFGYPLTAKAQLSLGDTWMQVITAGSTIALVASIILSCLASRLKGRGSIDGAGIQILKWLLLSILLFLNTVICISLRFAANISDWIVWPLGAINCLTILFIWYWYFNNEHPEILKGMKNDRTEEP